MPFKSKLSPERQRGGPKPSCRMPIVITLLYHSISTEGDEVERMRRVVRYAL